MLLNEVVATSAVVAETPSRLAKIEAIASCLRRATPDEAPAMVCYLSGELPQRRLGVGWATLRQLPPPAAEPMLELGEVDRRLAGIERVAGSGSAAQQQAEVAALFGRGTAQEQRFLIRLIGGELRQGAQAGVMAEAVGKAAGVPLAMVRRAAMLAGDLAVVAQAALAEGAAGLERFRLRVGCPVQPMLAQSAPDVGTALDRIRPAAVEWKLDGVRIQVHRSGGDVAIFTRTLDEVTDRMPEIVEAVAALPLRDVVLDGEAIALRPDGRPRPFQETGSRAASRGDVAALRKTVPLTPFFFDALHLDGEDLIDLPASARYAATSDLVPRNLWVPRLISSNVEEASAFFADAVGRGHEGVLVKAVDSRYEAGRRGAGWIKVKPRHTLDLVVLAAEWGHGRRQGWLSNLHLGARDPQTGGFVMLGKTFKGLTDEMLRWQTQRFQELELSRDSWTVYLKPQMVVEVAFDGIQTSPRYPGGMALRFARVVRYRGDKRADEADTIETLRQMHGKSSE